MMGSLESDDQYKRQQGLDAQARVGWVDGEMKVERTGSSFLSRLSCLYVCIAYFRD